MKKEKMTTPAMAIDGIITTKDITMVETDGEGTKETISTMNRDTLPINPGESINTTATGMPTTTATAITELRRTTDIKATLRDTNYPTNQLETHQTQRWMRNDQVVVADTTTKDNSKPAGQWQGAAIQNTIAPNKKIKKNKIQNTNHTSSKIRLLFWNIRGMSNNPNHPKRQFLRQSEYDFILLNEQWTQKHLPGYTSLITTDPYTSTRKINTSLFIKQGITFTERFKQEIDNTIFIQTGDLWIVTTYLRPGEKETNETIVSNIMMKIIEIKSKVNQMIILCGDINREDQLFELYLGDQLLNADLGPTHRIQRNGLWTLSSLQKVAYSGIRVETTIIDQLFELSDHAGIELILEVPKIYSNSRLRIPSTKYSRMIDHMIEQGNWAAIHDLYKNPKKLKKRIQIGGRNPADKSNLEELLDNLSHQIEIEDIININKKNWEKTVTEINSQIMRNSRVGWKSFRNISKIHLIDKKEGKIVQKIEKNEKIYCGGELEELLIEHFRTVHSGPMIEDTGFPASLVLSDCDVRSLTEKISSNKAISWDCIQDTSFRLCCKRMELSCEKCERKIKMIRELFKEEFWNKPGASYHLKCRLIALDKCHPKIPSLEEYRPIVITSAVLKLLEAYIIDDLRNYGISRLHKDQTGFVQGVGTQHNILRLVKEKRRLGDKGFIIFYDLKSAYDMVNRTTLYRIVQEKQILEPKKLQLLQFIHGNMEVSMGNKSCKTGKGVPQGMMTSPMLFNVFMESLLERLTSDKTRVLAYADDIAIACEDLDSLMKAHEIMEEWCEVNDMKINKIKSGILDLDRKGVLEDLKGIKKVKQYKYLGFDVSKADTIDSYLKRIRRKTMTILMKIKQFTDKLSLHQRRMMLKILIIPHLDYIGPIAIEYGNREVLKVRQYARRCARIILGLGRNTKNDVVELMVRSDRREVWIERYNELVEYWNRKGEEYVCSETERWTGEELDLKKLDRKIIDIANIFNRGMCEVCSKEGRKQYLNEVHLKEHGLSVSYGRIKEMIRGQNLLEIRNVYIELQKLV